MSTRYRTLTAASAAGLTLLLVSWTPPAVVAQSAQGAGWSAFLGCWQATVADGIAPGQPADEVVCVLPGDDDATVELATIVAGEVADRQRLVADGVERPTSREGCNGTERLEWSADGLRLYQHTRFECGGEIGRESSGILSIGPDGEWIVVQTLATGDFMDVRVQRYRAVSPASVGSELATAALSGRAMAIDVARSAARAPIGEGEIMEALARVEREAVEGWLIERGEGFDVDAERLVALDEAGLPGSVIDLMVALSFPEVFAIDRSAREGSMLEAERRPAPRGRPGTVVVLDPWYPGYYGYYPGRYRGGYYYDRYSRWYGRPVVIVRPPAERDGGGRLLNGRGYTRGGSSSGGGSTASPSGPRSSGGSASGSTGSTGSTGGSSGPAVRTAKPRGS